MKVIEPAPSDESLLLNAKMKHEQRMAEITDILVPELQIKISSLTDEYSSHEQNVRDISHHLHLLRCGNIMSHGVRDILIRLPTTIAIKKLEVAMKTEKVREVIKKGKTRNLEFGQCAF